MNRSPWLQPGAKPSRWNGEKAKFFVQPTEPNVATNLFIWTASGRLNYELDPAAQSMQMDFAIDQPETRSTAVNAR